jgi:hypothetical protein
LPIPTPTPVPGIAPTPLILPAIIETDKSTYLLGEEVRIKITLENTLGDEITLHSPEVEVKSLIGQPVKVFPAGSEEIKLKPGQTTSFNLIWDQKDNGQVLPGKYEILLTPFVVKRENLAGYMGYASILITYPQGALNKTLELNLSEGRLVLQRIIFTAESARFYVKTDIPVESPKVPEKIPTPPPIPPDALDAYSAKLKVDGREYPIKAWGYKGKSEENWTVIFLSNPLPSDAKEISLVVRNSEISEFNLSLEGET